jgi:cyclic pyranopterin phosphate synthase
LVRKGIVDLVTMIAGIEGVEDLSMTTNGTLLDRYAEALAAAGLKRVNISLDAIDPEKYRMITRGGDVGEVLNGITAAREAGLDPVKINCVVVNSSGEKDAMEVKVFCRENDLKVRFIHQMDLSNGTFSVVEGGDGGHCSTCNRLRLTSDGKVKPCLFSDLAFDVRTLGPRKALEMAVEMKPERGKRSLKGTFYGIGG